ncbi:MAG: uroporphyrinogen decarboxylase family protein, partial [Thermodesulfobacteriota bacterium]
MTSRQRILTAIRLDRPDRVPVSPFGLGRLDPKGKPAKELIAKTDPFISLGLGGNPFMGDLMETVKVENGNDTVTTVITPKGKLVSRYRRTPVTGYTVEFPCKTAEDVEKYLSIPYKPSEPDVEEFLARKKEIGEEGLVLAGIGDAICLPATILSPQDMCLLWADEPDLMIYMVKLAAERLNDFVEKACRKGVDAFRIVGGEYATEQLGPKGFAALVKPFDTELVSIMHKYGAIAYYHNHGAISRFLEDLADLGIDALDPLEVPPYGNVNLRDAKVRIGDRVCLVGGLDDMEVLETRDEATVKAMARKCIEAVGTKGYVLGGTASGTYTERAARNFIALV